jgi:hypothetical protein
MFDSVCQHHSCRYLCVHNNKLHQRTRFNSIVRITEIKSLGPIRFWYLNHLCVLINGADVNPPSQQAIVCHAIFFMRYGLDVWLFNYTKPPSLGWGAYVLSNTFFFKKRIAVRSSIIY